MMRFLEGRRSYSVEYKPFLEGMCEHHTLLQGDDGQPIAKIINDFGKHYSIIEYGEY